MNRFLVATLLVFSTVGLSATAQPAAAQEDYQAEFTRGAKLVDQRKVLEALPVFEDLVARNPKDDKAIVQLADCLISKAAVADATDLNEGARLRVRARNLLLQARDLGNTSDILKTNLELLTEDGKIVYKDTPIDRASRQAEADYSKADFNSAIGHYKEMLAIDPKRYDAALYIGDCYEQLKDWANAADWFERTIAIDPNRETAYRYYAVTLSRAGDMARSRAKFIQAVVAEPNNPRARRALATWSKDTGGSPMKDVEILLPLADPDAQKAYAAVKAKWQAGEFKTRRPSEKEYRLTLAEEAEALTAAADAAGAQPSPILTLLRNLRTAGMIEPYLLLSRGDAQIMKDYNEYRAANRAALENYLSEYVVPPAPAKK